MFKSKLLMMV